MEFLNLYSVWSLQLIEGERKELESVIELRENVPVKAKLDYVLEEKV